MDTYGNECEFNLCKRCDWSLLASVLASSLTASNCCMTKNCIREDPKGIFMRIDSFFQKVIGELRAAFFFFGNIKIGDCTNSRIKFILPLLFICKRAFTWSAPSVTYNGDTSISWSAQISWTCAVSSLGLGAVSYLGLPSDNNLPPLFYTFFSNSV